MYYTSSIVFWLYKKSSSIDEAAYSYYYRPIKQKEDLMSRNTRTQREELLVFAGYAEKFSKLPILLNGLGINHLQEHVDRPGGLGLWQWIQTSCGHGELILNGRTYFVDEGCGILLTPDTSHIYYSTSPLWYVNFLCFNGSCLPAIMENLKLDVPGVYRLTNPSLILDKELQLYNAFMENPSDAYPTSKIIYDLLLDLSLDIQRTVSGQDGIANEKVHKAIGFMYEHYRENISLQDIADAVQLSKEYLCQLFKKHTNFTVLDYLIRTRIANAKVALIKYPDQTVAQIARQCGFESPSYFCSVFKRYEGQTPGEFRSVRR